MKSSTNTVLLLECLFRAYGFPEFIESETGQYTLEIDDILFYFFDEKESSEIYIQADIAEYTSTENVAALIALLKINHLWDATNGGIIGLSPENNIFSYTYKIKLPLGESDNYDEYLIDLLPEIIRCIQYARSKLIPVSL
ncbi:type III secretion system chaperone [Citrobacter youngae]|uniref:type III secretion system chaperone n=1 Tax=Citrobacter youngae TaxID=133448 RepID=UPI001905BC21|nr:type III secretion system chaperone [Citrobacter youngae]MBJ8959875.1 type III secretion system chaperone [Citrobacter youngae]